MASPNTLNAQNLEALGAARCAALLIELASGNAQAKRRLRLELASSNGGHGVADQVRKRLATIGKARTIIDWRKVRSLAADLEAQRRAIMEHVATDDPTEAFDLLWRLLALASRIYDRSNDGSGAIAAVFDAARAGLVPLATAARLKVDTLVDHVFNGVCDNDYGQYNGLIGLLAEPLGETGLIKLRERFDALAQTPPRRVDDGERRVIGYGLAGPLYVDELDSRRHMGTVHDALTEIADALGDIDGFIAQHPPHTRENPSIAARIAERLLAAGRGEEALAALELGAPTRRKGGHWPTWDRVRIATFDALGREQDAQSERWALFAEALDASHLREHLKRLPDFEDFEAEQRALGYVRGFPSVHQALHFLLEWPELATASALVLARADEIDGNHYEVLTPAAEALETRYPLAATLLLRAMIDFALEQARHKRYPHAARHLESCEHLAQRIDDFGDHPDHAAYLAKLQAHHARKVGFWQA